MRSGVRLTAVLALLTVGVFYAAKQSPPTGSGQSRSGIIEGEFATAPRTLSWYKTHWRAEDRVPNAVAACFAEGTREDVMAHVMDQLGFPDEFRYNLVNRWPGSQGDPLVLTWSFIPDGVTIPSGIGEGSGTNELFSRMDSLFASQGGRATWILRFQQSFDRWQALIGTTYVRLSMPGQDWDDGAVWGSAGNGTTRGDVRICMKVIDGGSNTLAYNNFPSNGGDMVLDRAESWNSSANTHRFLRDVIMHEHGHGLGLAHVCPILGGTSGRLMEPTINTNIDGPQHDDIRGGQHYYGDNDEPNNSAAAAIDLGTVSAGVPVNRGNMPAPVIANTSIQSIDANAEQDYYKFTVNFGAKLSTISVTPRGFTYDSSTQAGNGSCNSGSFVDSLSARNLNFQVLGNDGVTVIATANSQPAGSAETLTDVFLSGSPGVIYNRVYDSTNTSQLQLYALDFTAQPSGSDVTPPSPNPSTWASPPAPLSATEITMTATTATDSESPPVEYFFDFTSGNGTGGTDSGWQLSSTYVDDGMQPNSSFNYRVRTRDSAAVPNVGTYSSTLNSPTHIETPVSVSFGAITDTSVEVFADGTFTNIGFLNTRFFFEMSPAHGSGANEWVVNPTTTVTGLTPGQTYTFRAKARNFVSLETPFCAPQNVITPGGSCFTAGDVNNDMVVNGADIAGFLRCKTGIEGPADLCLCADMGQGTLEGDVQALVDLLLGS
jgi:serralysin